MGLPKSALQPAPAWQRTSSSLPPQSAPTFSPLGLPGRFEVVGPDCTATSGPGAEVRGLLLRLLGPSQYAFTPLPVRC